jgi:dienelactone hydrolase
MNKRLILLYLSLFLSFYAININAHHEPATNKDGSIVTGVLTASWDPFGMFNPAGTPYLPFPSSLMYFRPDLSIRDMTLEIPVVDPGNLADPKVALSAMDGFSTTEKWVTGFSNNTTGRYTNEAPGLLDPASVTTGHSVRVFEVTTSQFLFVTGIVRELTPGIDYVALAITESKIGILPKKPLKEYTSYMAVLTNDIRDTDGNDATPDRLYNFGKAQTPWIDENGSTNPLFDDASAALLETVRQAVQSMELNAASAGINPADIVLSWTVHTQSKSRTLKTLHAYAQPADTIIGFTGMNTSHVNPAWPGIANIHAGIITLPYYLDAPTDNNPAAQLSTFWQAAPGAYAPPFDVLGLDPTSTHVTIANPLPVKKGDQTVPILVTVPNIMSKPANGWPVVIYGHGITRNRLDALAVADILASIGYATVAIDFPLHGVSPDAEPTQAPFWIENTDFAPIANERTFDSDFLNNETLRPPGDTLIDPSGVIFFPASLQSMLTSRDTIRQGIIDFSNVAVSISSMDIDLDGKPDLDATNIAYVGHSWGGIHGAGLVAIEPLITRAFLSVPAGGIARMANASDTFGPVIQGLLGSVGVESGTAAYDSFLIAWQTLLDSADPVNWGAEAAMNTPVMLHEVIDDDVVPNIVPFAPLSGTESLIAVMNLNSYSTSQASEDGLRSAGRFIPTAGHGSLLSPLLGSVDAYFEMQKQMATFIASHGGAIEVTNESTMATVTEMDIQSVGDLTERNSSKSAKGRKGVGSVNRLKADESQEPALSLERAEILEPGDRIIPGKKYGSSGSLNRPNRFE